AGDAQGADLQAGEVEVGVPGDAEVRRDRRVQAVAGVAGNVVLQRVGHLFAADELRTGDDAPEVGAGGVVAVLVGGQDVFDLARIQADRGHRRPFALEGEAGVPFDEDVAVGRFNEALPAEVAFDAATGDLPDAGDDRRGAGVGDPGFGRSGNFLVQVR